MASKQSMTLVIIQAVIEAAKAAIMVMRHAEAPPKAKTSVCNATSKWVSAEQANCSLEGAR